MSATAPWVQHNWHFCFHSVGFIAELFRDAAISEVKVKAERITQWIKPWKYYVTGGNSLRNSCQWDMGSDMDCKFRLREKMMQLRENGHERVLNFEKMAMRECFTNRLKLVEYWPPEIYQAHRTIHVYRCRYSLFLFDFCIHSLCEDICIIPKTSLHLSQ